MAGSVLYESVWDVCCCPILQLISTPNSRHGNNFWDQPLNALFSRVPTDNPVTADVGQIVPIIQLEVLNSIDALHSLAICTLALNLDFD